MQNPSRNRHAFRLVAVACVLLTIGQVSLALAAGPGAALCIGVDGHIEIEAAVDGECTQFLGRPQPASAEALPALVAADVAPGHCGECLDIALDSKCPAVEIRDAGAKDEVPAPALIARSDLPGEPAGEADRIPVESQRPAPFTRPIFLRVTAFLI